MIKRKSITLAIPLIALATVTQTHSAAATQTQANKSSLRKQRQDSYVLPKLKGQDYNQYIANELGWIPSNNPKNICNGYFYNTPLPPALVGNKKAPTKITAEGPEYFTFQGVSVLNKNIVVTQPGRIVKADKAYIFRHKDTGKITKVVLIGHVRIYQDQSVLVSDMANLTLYPKEAQIKNTAYRLHVEQPFTPTMNHPFNAWGTAASAHKKAFITTLHKATYSTCAPTHPTWTISAKKIVIDKKTNVGKAYGGVLRIHGIPIMYSPYYSFSLDHRRKSGFLSPIYGHNTDSGYILGLPYYWNMAANYDLLLTPEYYQNRGFKGSALFRYLTSLSSGSAYVTYLPDDKEFAKFRNLALATYSNAKIYNPTTYAPYLNALRNEHNYRGLASAQSHSQWNDQWSTRLYLNLVSDPYYFTDINDSGINANSTTNQLLNLLQIQYSGIHWQINGFAQAYQTLHLINQIQGQGQALDQYERAPDLNAVAFYPILPHLNFEMDSDATNFLYSSIILPTNNEGQRYHIRPGLSIPIEGAAGFIKPEVWFDSTKYTLQQTTPGVAKNPSRNIPIVDVDSGLYFDHQFKIKQHSYTQTFEPRLFYLYIPYKNQDNLPNFDTILLPFFFDQLFALNAFTGLDRIQNANLTTLGLHSSINDDLTGRTIFDANLGASYYFSQPRVCLTTPGCHYPFRRFSPIVTNATFYPNAHWGITGALAWDPTAEVTDNASISARYIKDNHRIITAGYRFVQNANNALSNLLAPINSTGVSSNSFTNNTSHGLFSFAWPITTKWSTLGFVDYNINQKRLDNVYGGIEYNSCCWAVRFVVRRAFFGSTLSPSGSVNNTFNISYYVEVTLKGLASYGNGKMDSLLKSTIPGLET